jgi:ATP-dependent Clp protease ATP-binding subunit ClpC
MERHAVSRLIGSPPGYVGYDEGGQLTEIVRHRPYSLILFDEIEKAHPEVFNILLQILDNGRLTDGKGKLVNFRNTIIILTSNVGSSYFRELSTLGFKDSRADEASEKEEQFRDRVTTSLKETFKPEFLNRLDEIVIFRALTPKSIEKIVNIQLGHLEERLKGRGIGLVVKANVKDYVVRHGFDPDYGARPIRRLIQKMIVDPLADKMIRGNVKDGQKVTVVLKKEDTVEITV